MFNHSGDRPRGASSSAGYGDSQQQPPQPHGLTLNTSGQPFPRFGVPQGMGGSPTYPPQQRQQDSVRGGFVSSVDWDQARMQQQQQQQRFNVGALGHASHQQQQTDGMELDELEPAPAGVSNLIARFEGIQAPPRSSNRVMSPMSSVASPTMASPASAHFSSMQSNSATMSVSGMSRITSPGPATPNYFRPQDSYRPPVPRKSRFGAASSGSNQAASSNTAPQPPSQTQSVAFSQQQQQQHQNVFSSSQNPFGHTQNNFSHAQSPFGQTQNNFAQPQAVFSPQQDVFSPSQDAFSPPANTFSPPPAPFSPGPFSPAPTPFSPATTTFSPAPTPAPSLIPGTPGGMQTPFGPPPPTSFPGQARAPSVAPTPKPATGSRPSRELVPAEAWESFKQTIKQLYLEERRPLKEVMQIMADQYGFQATPKMYKTRFSQWGFVKNNTEDEVKRLLSMKFQRDAEGKVSEFVRNGRVVNLGTYLKRKGVTEYDLVDFETPAQLPSYVRCRTPTPPPAPGYLRSPDLLRAQETVVGNMRKAFLHCRQFEVETDRQIGWTSIMLWGAGSSDMFAEANNKFEMGEHDAGGHLLMRAFKRLEMDLKQLSPQGIKELLLGMVHRDAGMMTALCKYLAAYSTTNFERSHPLRQTFSALYEVQQKHGPITLSELVWGCIPTIAEELEAIYGRRHPYVARTWIDLAIFYNHANPDRLEKLLHELQPLRRQIAGRFGEGSADDLALRYAVVQLMQAAWPNADGTKHEALNLWSAMKEAGVVFPVRGAEHTTFCYHSPFKVDPWERRCRDRYNIGVQFFQEHCGIKVLPYFEEDMHYTEHAPDSHSALAAALGHMAPSKFSLI
ncbi:hypothetical protein CTRI78_v010893 [Colletotrichum trifolii]|uniref:Clr5 domain-containing protein n=1 Tax=Colletotrichum trifolii TaxID=5466 RepID=A0A4R8QP79_COLTR|nr:hypothetical protein CTRI78_v010893 [Colletotrichum trifolii]